MKIKLSSQIILKIFFYFFIFTLVLPAVILSFTEHYTVAGKIANTTVPLGVTWLLASLSRKFGRTVWLMFPLMFIAAFQIVLLDLYGRSIIAVDMFLNLVTTNAGEVTELLSNMWPVVIFVFVVFLPQLIAAGVLWRRKTLLDSKFVKINRIIGVSFTGVGIIAVVAAYLLPGNYRVSTDLYPVNIGYNVALAVDRTAKTADYHNTSADYRFDAEFVEDDYYNGEYPYKKDTPEVLVLVIGETSRADNWQLAGYDRPTNPNLSKQNLLFFGANALSESNTTHKSVPMLLSEVDATNFNKIYNIKSLITAFKEAGYSTAFLSNQRRNNSFIDFFGEEADTVAFIRDDFDGDISPDSRLLGYLPRILQKNNPRQLIVLHTYGSHFNYNDRYEESDAKFTPTDYPEASAAYRDRLVNAYDNTIVATDIFLSNVIWYLEQYHSISAMMYTSDHGEDIYDDENGYFLHASPLPTYKQIHVPFLVWMSIPYYYKYGQISYFVEKNINKPISSSRSFFHTALGLGHVKTNVYQPEASLTDEEYLPRETLYLNDHNEPVKLEISDDKIISIETIAP
ncbi:MAG: lipid A phosphoethanolamine transferase [Lachnoclostridium sp.]|nr:lipid A phosphoethanolamine transferase [Lachnoclostridium sp.]